MAAEIAKCQRERELIMRCLLSGVYFERDFIAGAAQFELEVVVIGPTNPNACSCLAARPPQPTLLSFQKEFPAVSSHFPLPSEATVAA